MDVVIAPNRRIGVVMSSLCKKINALCEGSRHGRWGKPKGRKGSWHQARDLSGWRMHRHEKGIAFPSKILLLANRKYTPAWLYVSRIKKSALCRLKIKDVSGSETCVYSWYTSPHGSQQWFCHSFVLPFLDVTIFVCYHFCIILCYLVDFLLSFMQKCYDFPLFINLKLRLSIIQRAHPTREIGLTSLRL